MRIIKIIKQMISNKDILALAEALIIMVTGISGPVIRIPDAAMSPSPPVLTART